MAALGPSGNALLGANRTASNTVFSSTANAAMSWQTAGTPDLVPGLRMVNCSSPCTATCGISDPTCLSAASLVAQTCSPQWDAYSSAAFAWTTENSAKYASSYTDIIVYTETYESSVFSSTSTDSSYAVSDHYGSHPHAVYMFGTASLVPSTEYATVTETYYGLQETGSVDEIQVYTTNGRTVTTTSPYTGLTQQGFPIQTPFCSLVDVEATVCGNCMIGGGTVQLYYWPTGTSTGTGNNAVATNSVNGTMTSPPRTAVIDGVTMVSPSVYISMQTVGVGDWCGTLPGNNISNLLLPMRPQDVSTMFGTHTGSILSNGEKPWQADQARQINYADLEGPVPASIYEASPECVLQGCVNIYNDYYHPILAVPPKLRALNPAWANCDLQIEGLYDPPRALTGVVSVAAISLPGRTTSSSEMTTTPAIPCSTPDNSLPPATSHPRSSSQVTVSSVPAASTVLPGPSEITSSIFGEESPSDESSLDSPKASPSQGVVVIESSSRTDGVPKTSDQSSVQSDGVVADPTDTNGPPKQTTAGKHTNSRSYNIADPSSPVRATLSFASDVKSDKVGSTSAPGPQMPPDSGPYNPADSAQPTFSLMPDPWSNGIDPPPTSGSSSRDPASLSGLPQSVLPFAPSVWGTELISTSAANSQVQATSDYRSLTSESLAGVGSFATVPIVSSEPLSSTPVLPSVWPYSAVPTTTVQPTNGFPSGQSSGASSGGNVPGASPSSTSTLPTGLSGAATTFGKVKPASILAVAVSISLLLWTS